METFFSSTDTATLQSEGSNMNHFVSLIVNNEGTYTAAITKKVTVTQNIQENCTYNTWKNKEVPGNASYTLHKEYIQWFNLDIEIEKLEEDYISEMLERLKDIRENKRFSTPLINKRKEYSKAMAHNQEEPLSNIEDELNNSSSSYYSNVTIDDKVINLAVMQTLACSVLVSPSLSIDLIKWANNIEYVYQRRFGNIQNFEVFASNFADYIINFTELPQCTDNEDDIAGVLAYKIKEKLRTLPRNKWVDAWIKVYDYYIM